MALWRFVRRWSWLFGATFTVTVAGTVVVILAGTQDSSRTAARLGALRADAERVRAAARASEPDDLDPAIEQWYAHLAAIGPELRVSLGESRASTAQAGIAAAFVTLEESARSADLEAIDGDTAAVIGEVNGVLDRLSLESETAIRRARDAAIGGITVSLLAAAVGLGVSLAERRRIQRLSAGEAILHRRYESLIEHSSTVFMSTDAAGIISTVNASEENAAIRDWAGQPLSLLLSEDVIAMEAVRRSLSDGRPRGRQVEYRGRVYRFDWRLREGLDENPTGLDIVVSDVTDRVRFDNQLRIAFDGVIGVITKLTDLTDPYTQGHEETVADIAEALALRLEWGPRAIEGLRIAARLHDMGKVAVPAELLARPGALHPVELELIKLHVEHARQIFRGIQFPWPEIRAVYEHHERLDGSGYPRGLSGDEISMAGRILAVADVCDAMTSHRPYRPARSRAELVQELRAGQHRRYDEKVVDIAVSLIESGEMPFRQSLGSDRHGEVRPPAEVPQAV